MILSYISILFSTLYGFIITPYMVGTLGEAEYGVYKTIAAMANALMVLDFGLGGTVMRYVASYRANKEDNKIPNFVAMQLMLAAVMAGVIMVAAAGVFPTIRPTYSATFTEAQIQKSQLLFVLLIVNMVIHVFSHVIGGVISGSNHFIVGKSLGLTRLVVRSLLIVVLLKIIPDSVVLVLIDMGLSIGFLLFDIFYVRIRLGVRIKLTKFDRSIFMESGKYSVLLFLTSICAQVNNSLDNVIIGAISGPELVTVYSMGLLIFAMFENLSTAVSGVMLPTVSKLIAKPDGESALHQLIIRAGRVQFMLLGAAYVGFICIGKDFLNLWLGPGYEDVYIITIILMTPAMFELCVNTCLAVLRAKNKLGFRTGVLFASTALNAVVTILAVKYWSYIGAAFGTAASFLLGSLVVMNIYYAKKMSIPIFRIYGGILSRIWICLLLAGGALWIFSRFVHGSVLAIIAGIAVFGVVYGIMMWTYGLSKEEKRNMPVLNRFIK